jgi:hypothetical protein
MMAIMALLAIPLGGLAATPVAAAAQSSGQAAADALLAADRGFSAAGSNAVLVDALAPMFDADVIMPLPTGTFAKGKDAALAALRANPSNSVAHATWAPVRAGISADGRQGFTYGFMTIREAGKPDRRAKYLTYWVRRADGWRAAAYKRAGGGEGAVQTALRASAAPPAVLSAAIDEAATETHRASLAAAEKAFSDRAQEVGLGKAFVEFGLSDAMNMGRGADFTFGNAAIGADMPPDTKSPVHWAADERVIVAGSGDLGVTVGFIRPHVVEQGQPAASPFFTIWRRDSPEQPWRYVAE